MTLDSFYDELSSKQPAPAGVAAAAVSARLGIALLIKVLEIRRQPAARIETARREAAILKQAAEDDIQALTAEHPAFSVEIPMRAARAATAGLQLCANTAGSIRGMIAADLGAAAALLAGAARAILLCVEFNLSRTPSEAVAAECLQLGERVEELAAQVSGTLAR